LSKSYLNINNPAEAQAYLDIVLDNPYRLTDRDQFLAKSQYYFITGDNDKRIKVLQMYMDLYPLDIEAYNQLGESLYELGDYDEAEKVFIDGLKIDDYRGEFLRRLGHINKAKRNYNEALKYYEMYREKYPDVSRTYKLLGGFHLETGNFDEAEINLEKAVLLDRRAIRSRIDLIEIKQRKGQFDEAIEEYGSLLEKCNTLDDSIQVMLAIRDYYYLRGEINRGLKIRDMGFKLAATLYKPINMSFYIVTNLYWFYEVGKDSIALNILEQEEKKLSDSYANITAFGYINYYLRKNDVENASKQYERISDFVEEFGSPSSVEVFFRARLYKLEGEYEKAIDTYESFRLQNSYVSNAVIDNRIAECYISNNQYDKAENILKDLLKTYPFDPTTYYHLAIIYNEQGKLNDARASIEIANKIWINADEAYAKAQQAKTLYNILQPVL
jgi:tetratricopeptide (TPR) repeat protein